MTSRPAKRASSGGSAPAREPDPDPATGPDGPPPAPDPEPKTGPVRRAGGHVDRGDGRGWVLDDDQEV